MTIVHLYILYVNFGELCKIFSLKYFSTYGKFKVISIVRLYGFVANLTLPMCTVSKLGTFYA